MKTFVWSLTGALALSWPILTIAKDLSPRDIYEQVSPAVVMVMGHADGKGRNGSGGTGSIIQSDGYVLTNAHVVVDEETTKPYPRLSVFLKPARVTGDTKADLSRMVKAKVVAYSRSLDLALVKLESLPGQLPAVGLSDSEHIKIGDRVVAIGHPEQGGLWTLTTGVISAEVDNFNGVPGKHVFQTEAGLNRGNSGGPLLDNEGRLIGINTAIARVAADGLPITSISFSLKSNVAAQWLREQGVGGREIQTTVFSKPTPAAAEGPPVAVQPRSLPVPPKTNQAPAKPKSPVESQAGEGPSRPYNLDQLVNDRAKAEADLEHMLMEMRGSMKER